MRKIFMLISTLLLVLFGTVSVSSAIQVTLLDQVFTRGAGKPAEVTEDFPALGGQAVVRLTNGSSTDRCIFNDVVSGEPWGRM